MHIEVRQKTTVQPGGIVEIQASELPEGAEVEVVVILSERDRPDSLASLIGTAPSSFTTSAQADAFIRQERDAWES